MSRTRALAQFAAHLDWPSLPAGVRAHASILLLDVIGMACAGLAAPETARAQATASRWGAGDEAVVIGTGVRLPAAGAAFANAYAARIHTFDDTFEPGIVHSGNSAVAAALATAERCRAHPLDFLAAVVAGYEVTARIAAAIGPAHYRHGFHNTGTIGAFGAAAAAARALRRDAQATEEILGLAAATAAGIRQHQLTGSLSDTALHGGRAAQGGVGAADLHECGLRGPLAILDGEFGFCRVTCAEPKLDALDAGLGSRFEISRTTVKPFPSCRFTHGPIEAALSLRQQHGIAPEAIESVAITGFRQSMEVSCRPLPRSRTNRILSHQYTVAVALLDGRVDLASFDDDRANEPGLLALAERIDARPEPSLDATYPRHQSHRVVIRMRDGSRLEAFSEDPPGAGAVPLPPDLPRKKFLRAAGPVLGAGNAEALAAVVTELEALGSLDPFLRLLVRPAD